MAVISGLDMAIGSVPTVHQFRMEIADELIEYISSGGQSGVGNKCGIDDWRGVAMAYGYLPPVYPGNAAATFTASLDGTYGFTGTAYVESVEITWDIENGKYLGYSIQYSRNGALTIGGAAATDAVKPNPPCVQSLPLKIGTVEVNDVSFMRLKLSCQGFPRVTSGTSGGRMRTRGAMSAELEYHCYYQNPGTLPTRGLRYNVKPYCTSTLFWDINWMKVATIAPYSNPASRRPVNAKVLMKLDSSNGTDMGSIKTPEAAPVTIWPFS